MKNLKLTVVIVLVGLVSTDIDISLTAYIAMSLASRYVINTAFMKEVNRLCALSGGDLHYCLCCVWRSQLAHVCQIMRGERGQKRGR